MGVLGALICCLCSRSILLFILGCRIREYFPGKTHCRHSIWGTSLQGRILRAESSFRHFSSVLLRACWSGHLLICFIFFSHKADKERSRLMKPVCFSLLVSVMPAEVTGKAIMTQPVLGCERLFILEPGITETTLWSAY